MKEEARERQRGERVATRKRMDSGFPVHKNKRHQCHQRRRARNRKSCLIAGKLDIFVIY